MLRKGRLSRLARLGGMAAGLVGDAAGATAQMVTETTGAAAASFHRHAARRMLRVFGEMKGLPLKAGQMLSYIDEVLPPDYRHIYNEALGNLQMHTPTMDWATVREVFVEEFEGREPEQIFGAFETEPIAAASIGQVYHARTLAGDEVAVKVQYPGVAEAVKSDLANVESLMSAMAAVLPKADFQHMVHDIVSRIEEECDYVLEAQNQRDFARAWKGDSHVVIPGVERALSTRRVLTSEFLHAQEWGEMRATASPELQSHYGTVIFRFVFESLFAHGMFNGDPHPGNYMFYPDGRVAFIDFGCVQRYDEVKAQAFRDLRKAVLDGADATRFRHLVSAVFGLPGDLDEEMLELLENYLHLTFEPITAPQPYKFERSYAQNLLQKGMDAKMVLWKKLVQGKNVNVWESQNTGVAFLGRINFGLGSILTTLGTEGDFRAMIEAMD